MTPSGQTICLCMIVKNEAPVIRRCLDSVRPIIDHWIIVDTGSTDGTQEIVRTQLKYCPGELVERSWRDFSYNRNEALALARPHGDYTLVIDADDNLEWAGHFDLPALHADAYMFTIVDGTIRYQRQQLVSSARPWRYDGILHEYLTCEGSVSVGHFPVVMRRNHDGARHRDADTYRKDAALLRQALATETRSFLQCRYTFYLAQSYRDCGEAAPALQAYLDRASMGGWDQEIFISLFEAAKLMQALGRGPEEVLATYQRATDACPSRAEASHGASRLCRSLGYNERGHAIAKCAIGLPVPANGLFIEPWIYQYGALDEFAVNAYWAGLYDDCLRASVRALDSGAVPAHDQPRILKNVIAALDKLPRSKIGKPAPVPSLDRSRPARLPSPAPRVLVAILAKQKEPVLRLHLDCIEALDYPKSSIVLYVRTNNNTDRTGDILREWLDRVSADYARVDVDDSDVVEPVQSFGVHEWNATRFRVLGAIRNASLRKTVEHDCAFYFVADVDNFFISRTLRDLVALDLPIVAPLLRDVDPASRYSNFHADIDHAGYYMETPRYDQILLGDIIGLIEVPVVHCTYLIRADVLANLSYDDATGRFEYVVFCDSARRHHIPQYVDNRQVYGLLTLDDAKPDVIAGQLQTIAKAIGLPAPSILSAAAEKPPAP